MPTITCPNCDRTFDIETSILGKKVQCAYCREVFVANTEKDQEIIILRPSSETVQNNTMRFMNNNVSKSSKANSLQKQIDSCPPAYDGTKNNAFENYYDAITIWKIALHQKELIMSLWFYLSICFILLGGAKLLEIISFPVAICILFCLSLFFLLPVNRTARPLREAMGKSPSSTEALLFFNFFLPIIGFILYLPTVFSATGILWKANLSPGLFGVSWSIIKKLKRDAVRSPDYLSELNRQQKGTFLNDQETLTALKQYSSLLVFGPGSVVLDSHEQQKKDDGNTPKKND